MEAGIPLRVPVQGRNKTVLNIGGFKSQEPTYRNKNVTFTKENPKFAIEHKVISKRYIIVPETQQNVRIMPINAVSVIRSNFWSLNALE